MLTVGGSNCYRGDAGVTIVDATDGKNELYEVTCTLPPGAGQGVEILASVLTESLNYISEPKRLINYATQTISEINSTSCQRTSSQLRSLFDCPREGGALLT